MPEKKQNDSAPVIAFRDGVIYLSGNIIAYTVGDCEKFVSSIKHDDIQTIDGSAISSLDTSGTIFIKRLAENKKNLRGFSENSLRLIEISKISTYEKEKAAAESRESYFEKLGETAIENLNSIKMVFTLLADILYWGTIDVFNRKQYRKGSFTEQAFFMGSSALPIIGTILFLIGAISVLQSTSTLRDFGATVFVADLLTIGLARELAPLLTAIIVSGRSGSAIASEIATMKFTEELDAIKTMGLNPIRFVVIPKLWAMVVCMPLLTIMALSFGLLGGFPVAVTYSQLSPNTYIDRVFLSLFFWDISTGLIKSISFAVIIVVVGVYRGLRFTGGAEGVGRATTSSVVTAIFTIIIMDSIWGIIFYFRY